MPPRIDERPSLEQERVEETAPLLDPLLGFAPRLEDAELTLRLSERGAEALVEALALLQMGTLDPREQDHARATFAPKVDRSSARIDWSRDAAAVGCHVRGMDDVPGAWTTLRGEAIKLFGPRLHAAESAGGAAGEVSSIASRA